MVAGKSSLFDPHCIAPYMIKKTLENRFIEQFVPLIHACMDGFKRGGASQEEREREREGPCVYVG
jgi:hypothetical protein